MTLAHTWTVSCGTAHRPNWVCDVSSGEVTEKEQVKIAKDWIIHCWKLISIFLPRYIHCPVYRKWINLSLNNLTYIPHHTASVILFVCWSSLVCRPRSGMPWIITTAGVRAIIDQGVWFVGLVTLHGNAVCLIVGSKYSPCDEKYEKQRGCHHHCIGRIQDTGVEKEDFPNRHKISLAGWKKGTY